MGEASEQLNETILRKDALRVFRLRCLWSDNNVSRDNETQLDRPSVAQQQHFYHIPLIHIFFIIIIAKNEIKILTDISVILLSLILLEIKLNAQTSRTQLRLLVSADLRSLVQPFCSTLLC